MTKFLVLLALGGIGGALIITSHRQAKQFRASSFISARSKHLIGLLLIFAALVIFASQFLIYTKQ